MNYQTKPYFKTKEKPSTKKEMAVQKTDKKEVKKK